MTLWETLDAATVTAAQRLAAALEAKPLVGLVECATANDSVTVLYDPVPLPTTRRRLHSNVSDRPPSIDRRMPLQRQANRRASIGRILLDSEKVRVPASASPNLAVSGQHSTSWRRSGKRPKDLLFGYDKARGQCLAEPGNSLGCCLGVANLNCTEILES